MINIFFRAFDFLLKFFVGLFVSYQNMEKQITSISELSEDEFKYYREEIDTVQSRASILLSHISILLAVLAFSVSNYKENYFMVRLFTVEIISLLIVSLVLMRIIGSAVHLGPSKLNFNEYLIQIKEECVRRFCYFIFASFISTFLTIILIVGFILHPPI